MADGELIFEKNFEAFRGVVNSIAFQFSAGKGELLIRENRITATGSLHNFSKSSEIDHTTTLWTVRSSNSDARITAFLIDDQKTKIIFEDGIGFRGQKC